MAMLIENNFEDMVNYKFPIATSITDFEQILRELNKLHIDFIKTIQSYF
jgi:hypothetical protein